MLTPEQKNIECAKLDGWEYYPNPENNLHCVERKHQWFDTNCGCCYHRCNADYFTSYDAIIPLIQKQNIDVLQRLMEIARKICTEKKTNQSGTFWIGTPSQLQDALLKAHGFEV